MVARQTVIGAGLCAVFAVLLLVTAHATLAQDPDPPTEPPPTSSSTTTTTTTSTSTTTTTTAKPVTEEQATTSTTARRQTTTTTVRSTTPTAPVFDDDTDEQSDAGSSTTSTSNPYLVPGGDATGGQPGPGSTSPVPASSTRQSTFENDDSTGTVVALAIAGLLVVALLLGVLTYRFWRNTRPQRPAPKPALADEPEARRIDA